MDIISADNKIIIIGAGLAGLSAAITLAKEGVDSVLISSHHSERAQSVMAEGGINAALNTKGEGDSPEKHFEETFKAGRFIADEKAVREMTAAAPDVVKELESHGVCFNRDENGNIDLRNFGGQKYKRTAFAKSDSGKQIMTALIDEVRRLEVEGKVERLSSHDFVTLLFSDGDKQLVSSAADNADEISDRDKRRCTGALVRNRYTGETIKLIGSAVIMAVGGLHGLFENTTGSLTDTGEAAAELFRLGVTFADLEFIQYHPTTVSSGGKRMLISEAARGEGGRLFADTGKDRIYFMEEKYPELGNLMPRDVTSREIFFMRKKYPVYLDMSHLPEEIIDKKLAGLARDCAKYLKKDIKKEPVEVAPGIHYFMGGIYTGADHETEIKGLFAAGECCALYHGANRLGGNSLLGAVYGGKKAALSALRYANVKCTPYAYYEEPPVSPAGEITAVRRILSDALGVVRNGEAMRAALQELESLSSKEADFARAFLQCALFREESRGAHFREDFPEERDEYRRRSIAKVVQGVSVDHPF